MGIPSNFILGAQCSGLCTTGLHTHVGLTTQVHTVRPGLGLPVYVHRPTLCLKKRHWCRPSIL